MNKIQQEIKVFHEELALEICEITHEVEFSFEFRGWNSGIQNFYGLEIRIARELSRESRRNHKYLY